jgi:hypothetical protein
VQAAVYYVDCDRPDNTGDGLSWATAKRTIQAAIDVATNGDTIRVGPGTYGEGTTPTPDSIIRSRVVCEKAIVIESTGGAEATIILGERDPLDTSYQGTGANAVRCVYMSAGTLTGFTLTGGATHSDITENSNCRGGGLLAASFTPVVYDCIVSNNAARRGGGAYKGTFHRTRFLGNFASQNGAGVRESRLHDCLLAFNNGGAVAYCNSQSLFPVNCTIARNTGAALDCSGGYNLIVTENGNAFAGTRYSVVDSCIQYATNVGSNNLVTTQAHFVDSANGDFRLLASSPCLDRGNPAWTGAAPSADQRTDLAGNPRLQGAALDLGALEGAVSGVAVVTCTAPTGNGTLTPQGHFFLPVLPTQLLFTATADAGSVLRHFSVNGYKQKDCGTTFALRIKDPGAVYIVTAEFRPARYVDPAGSDANDGTSSATAWRTLQHAATTAPSGSMVLAAPGTYNEGHAFGALHSNRVVVTRNIVLKATAGPEQTVIEGATDPDSTLYGCGTNAMRCLYISAGAVEGFTLTGGAGSVSPGDKDADNVRGGAVFATESGTLWDCVISNNVASRGAAGFGGTFNRCLVTGNRVYNNGTFRAAEVYDCLIVNNIGNWAGVFGGRFYGCTISGQSAGGGIGESTTAYNTILFDNAVQDAAAKAICINCCTGGQLRPGAGNIAADPLFVDAANGDFRLRADSPCINAGDATYGTGIGGADFVGAPRVQGGQYRRVRRRGRLDHGLCHQRRLNQSLWRVPADQ